MTISRAKSNTEPADPFDTDRKPFWRYQGAREIPLVQLPLHRKDIQGIHAICDRAEHK